MEAVLLKGNSTSDIELIITLAEKLDIQISRISNFEFDNIIETKSSKQNEKHNFLNSQGIWKNRTIDAKLLRNDAWKIQD